METIKAIAKRKSTRGFTPQQIPADALDTLLAAGCAAPVGMRAYDTLHLTVVQNAQLLQEISDAATKASGREGSIYYGAPTVVIISSKKPAVPGIEYANAGCIAENILLAATDLGIANIYILGTVGGFAADPTLLAKAGIPDGFFPVSSVALGYPAEVSDDEKTLAITIGLNRV
jgi:nitroreductase